MHFGPNLTHNVAHSLAFETTFSNAVTGFNLGAAVGGSDFNPLDKSESELQRFCQSFSLELSKYIGPDVDVPFVGTGCGQKEMGYIYGQYKRIKPTANFMSNSDMLQVRFLSVFLLFCREIMHTKILFRISIQNIYMCIKRTLHRNHCFIASYITSLILICLHFQSLSYVLCNMRIANKQHTHTHTHCTNDNIRPLASLLFTLQTVCYRIEVTRLKANE